jgi:hypothetical protein
MRKIWLSSVALMMTTSMAFAQSTTTSPSANATPNAPQTSASGAPGKTPPAPSSIPAPSIPATTSSNTVPVPNGVPGIAAQTPAGAAPGKTTPGDSTSGSGSKMTSSDDTMGTMPHHKMHRSMLGMPPEGSAAMYLHIAKDALHQHNKMRADDALSRAETRLLTRAVPASASGADDAPAISAIESARKALAEGNMTQAATDTDMAMHQIH